jgi:TPR repeat protein
MMALGYASLTGQGMDSDYDQAARWFELAALAGRTDALEAYESLR